MAAADGRLDERERLYINEITGYAESVQGMIDSMKQSGVVMSDDREGFAQTPFKCLVIALLADSVYQEAGKDSQILKLALTFTGRGSLDFKFLKSNRRTDNPSHCLYGGFSFN